MDNVFKELPSMAITVSNKNGEIVDMNDRSVATFGEGLIGKNLMDCHPERAKQVIASMIDNASSNAYTIEKNGEKKLIYQTPYYKDGEFAGLVEFSIVIPAQMPHFVRE